MENGRAYRTTIPDIEFWKQMVRCQAACPVHTDSGRYVQLIAEGDDRGAYLAARSPNPFASVCGRVCAAPCEDRCRRAAVDAAVSIRALKRFVCERFGAESVVPGAQEALFQGEAGAGNRLPWHLPLRRSAASPDRRVGVIGAGAAGLACAHDLAVMGYRVTVFEAGNIPGGMMFHGIPEFRLPRSVIDLEIGRIERLGVELNLNTPLKPGFGLKRLRDGGYQAVFLAVGTQRGRDLAIDGSDLDGVIRAIDFLLNVNHGYRIELGRRVVVIGGGFVAFDAARAALRATAFDAARAAIRAGVAEVRMISLESFDEMPVLRSAQGREEFEEAQREGIVFHPQRGAKRFLGEDGPLRSVELIGVRSTYDADGRFAPVYDDSVAETLEADSVILAIGQRADLSFLEPEDGVEITPQGTIKIDPATLATTAPGIFAGGDAAFGPRNLIEAIANGKQAARSIDNYLRGGRPCTEVHLAVRQVRTRDYCMAAGYEKQPRQAPPTTDLARRTGISEVEHGYSEEEARAQAERCLYCHVQTIYDAGKCVLCNRCVEICPQHCLKLVPAEELELDREVEWPEGGGPFSAMIKDDEKCIRCGLCAIRCPADAMTMEVFSYEEREVV